MKANPQSLAWVTKKSENPITKYQFIYAGKGKGNLESNYKISQY